MSHPRVHVLRGSRWGGLSRWGLSALAGIAGAGAAGTLPDVIKDWLGSGPLLLTVVCVASAATFAMINWWQQRSRGIGIVISLPLTNWRQPWTPQWPQAAIDHATQHHDSCFVVERAIESVRPGLDSPPEKARKRKAREEALHFAFELVNARLVEISRADPAAPISLYVNVSLSDAYDLGAKLKFNVHRGMRATGPGNRFSAEPAASTRPILAQPPAVQQRSELSDDFYPALSVSSRLKVPLTAVEQARVTGFVAKPEIRDLGKDPNRSAVALIIHLADNPAMIGEAVAAAADGCIDAAGKWARCSQALIVDGRQGNLPERAEDVELVVRHIYSDWRDWRRRQTQGQRQPPPCRLFIAAPVSVAFALGWLMGHTVRVVPHPYDTEEPT